jgi:S1-C subfamily serine protease
VITKVGDKEIKNAGDLSNARQPRSRQQGEGQYVRNGATQSTEVTLGEQPTQSS